MMRNALLFMLCVVTWPAAGESLQYDQGGIIRGDVSRKRLSLVFTAGDHGEGVRHILGVCEQKKIKAAFFVTGDYLRANREDAKLIVAAGHLLGPHSDRHLLYCDWNDRARSLVSERQFKDDLAKNIAEIEAIGAKPSMFIPPYEWFNQQHVAWAKDLGLTLINFTPGSGSNRDYIPEDHPKFVPSTKIVEDILAYEQKDAHGLSGFILLLHAGSKRDDKMHLQLAPLVDALQQRGYEIVRVDEMLDPAGLSAPPVSDTASGDNPTRDAKREKLLVIRANQIGYLPDDPKIAILSSDEPQKGEFMVGEFKADIGADHGEWGPFKHNYRLNFSDLKAPGRYDIAFGGARSLPFNIGEDVYSDATAKCLAFMHLQRCGENPVTGKLCHQQDAIDAVTGKFIDLTGGWHDAADRIKHNITTSYCVAALFLAGAEDEARYGARYLKKIHPGGDTIYVQVGDDRDHSPPSKLWHEDQTDYGHGAGGTRVAWPALGAPQGPKFQNKSDGVASLAGRCAAAMALAGDLKAAKALFELGKRKPGVAMSVPVKAPYYYGESTWTDDMQWGAIELYLATREDTYLKEAIKFADAAQASEWMGRDRHGHYEFFPYINLAHWRLYPHVDDATKRRIAGYYREGLRKIADRANRNPYRLGTPLVWCSTNDVIAFATQAQLYEQMTGEREFRGLAAEARDWIFGRNPWGVSFVIGVPETGNPSTRPHHLFHKLTNHLPVGGLVDGPVYKDINDSLKFGDFGEDKYARFQSEAGGVYHDVFEDFSTNEPIIDGTVSLMLLMKVWK